eukprot:TRINITY_DN14644_c0_g1_i1.p1 TRINITY_DN14644_c0_g1~~TRINITY_DN14644_c0_g1_i1.p1  ORF type:complete len:109 (-),score=37.87 TRINITY_DN14644_c0_g1_i1:67-393(-)
MSTAELACTYAALLLNDADVAISADKIRAVLKAANVEVEAYWPALFAKLLASKKITDLISGVGAAAPAAAAPAAAAPAAAAKEEPKKEAAKKKKSESEDGDMGFGLFD